ncbi:hypothetical protein ACWKWP_10880 [Agromyces soli]
MIELYTAQLATSVVTTVCGVMFILDTLFGRADASGRLWAVSYMSGMLTSIAYAIWILMPGAWWAVAVGNGAMVFTAGLLWSGARAFDGRSALVWAPGAGAVVAALAVLLAGPDGGAWAGAGVLFVGIALFSVLGAVESLHAPMRESWAGRGLTVAFLVIALYYVLRTGVLLVAGPDSSEFRTLFGSEASAFVMMTLIIVTTVCLVVLRGGRGAGERAGERGAAVPSATGAQGAPVPSADAQRALVEDWLERASFHDEQFVFTRVRLDEVEAIDLAFGRSAGAALAERFAAAVRRYSPPAAAVGVLAQGELLVVAPFPRVADARRAAAAVQAGLGEQLVSEAEGIRLSSSIGLAGTDAVGYDYARLLEASREALGRARESGGDTIAD